jgi:hypothetical protein
VSFVVQVFDFPITAITRDDGDSGDPCGPLPASLSQAPTPHKRFVENKSQTPIRPNCHRAVESPFFRFSGIQAGSISALFARSYCPVGRGSQSRNVLAECLYLIAVFSKIFQLPPLGASIL